MVEIAVAFYLGIDGGGTKTSCALGDEASVLGRGSAGGSNVVRVGEAAAREALQRAVREACASASVDSISIDPTKITRTVAGVAGVGAAEVRGFVERTLREMVGGELVVASDAETTLYAAFSGSPGVVVISGTGSIALAQDGEGKMARAGGWGWAISDEGSGPWIGRAAVGAALSARDAGERTLLEESVLRAWQLADWKQLVRAANAVPQPDFGALLPLVVAAAEAGDPIAGKVFRRAGRELAALAETAASRVFDLNASVVFVDVPIAMSGGALTHAHLLREAFSSSVKTLLPNAVLSPDLADPLMGALQMARRS